MEYMFALGIGGLLLAVLAAFSMHHGKSVAVLSNMVDLDQANRIAQAQMSRDFRQARHLSTYSTNDLTFVDYDGTALRYVYSPSAKTLSRIKNGVTTVLLKECDRLNFTIRQRNIISGTFDYYNASTPDTCKVVGVDWTCSRTMFGKKSTMTSSQSARIAIRKH